MALRRAAYILSGSAAAVVVYNHDHFQAFAYDQPVKRWGLAERVPSRAEQFRRLSEGTADKPYDLLVIGGGATGTGCTLDAVTR